MAVDGWAGQQPSAGKGGGPAPAGRAPPRREAWSRGRGRWMVTPAALPHQPLHVGPLKVRPRAVFGLGDLSTNTTMCRSTNHVAFADVWSLVVSHRRYDRSSLCPNSLNASRGSGPVFLQTLKGGVSSKWLGLLALSRKCALLRRRRRRGRETLRQLLLRGCGEP